MRVDQESLRDLGVVSMVPGEEDVRSFLDRTASARGRKALFRRLTEPLASVEEIEEVQEALRFLMSHPGLSHLLLADVDMRGLDRYLHLNHTSLERRIAPLERLEAEWVRFRDADHVDKVGRGVEGIRLVMEASRRLARALDAGPALLSSMAAWLRAFLDGEVGSTVAAHMERGGELVEVLRLDRYVRGQGKDEFLEVIRVLAELDALVSMAKATEELGYVLPRFGGEGEGEGEDQGVGGDGMANGGTGAVGGGPVMELEGAWHPFVPDPVPNDLRFSAGTRLAFLTGPNMAGKSTYLKAVGITVHLAHCGMGVPARSLRLGFFSRLLSAVRTTDNVREGVSFFQAEARRIRTILDALGDDLPCFVLIDEPFQGTNVKDAREATLLVLNGFDAVSSSCFVVASHLVEVADHVRGFTSSQLLRFEAGFEGGKLVFSYRIQRGVSDQLLGMRVLEREGVLDALSRLRRADPRQTQPPGPLLQMPGASRI